MGFTISQTDWHPLDIVQTNLTQLKQSTEYVMIEQQEQQQEKGQ